MDLTFAGHVAVFLEVLFSLLLLPALPLLFQTLDDIDGPAHVTLLGRMGVLRPPVSLEVWWEQSCGTRQRLGLGRARSEGQSVHTALHLDTGLDEGGWRRANSGASMQRW